MQTTNAEGFLRDLGRAAQENPIPAALIGVGALWLLAGGRNATLGEAPRALASGVGTGLRSTGAVAGHGLQSVAHGVASAGRFAATSGRDAASTMGEVASSALDSVGSASDAAMDFAREHAPRWGSSEQDESSASPHRLPAQSHLSALLSQQPLLLGLVGLAIGAGLATAFKATQTENRLFGEMVDSAKATGLDSVSRGLQRAEELGLTPKAAGDAARSVVSKVAQVAENASDEIATRVRG